MPALGTRRANPARDQHPFGAGSPLRVCTVSFQGTEASHGQGILRQLAEHDFLWRPSVLRFSYLSRWTASISIYHLQNVKVVRLIRAGMSATMLDPRYRSLS
eukprot:g79360.t1